MKCTLVILTVLIPFFAQAGGGGGLRPGMESGMVRPEIVYHLGESNGITYFAYGELENKQWNIQKANIPTIELNLDYKTKLALKASQENKNWVEIK